MLGVWAHAQGCVSVCVRCSTADSPVYWDHVEQVSFQDRDLNVHTHASLICNIFFNKCVCLSAVRRTYAVPVYKKKEKVSYCAVKQGLNV